jgi:hypothetical protein
MRASAALLTADVVAVTAAAAAAAAALAAASRFVNAETFKASSEGIAAAAPAAAASVGVASVAAAALCAAAAAATLCLCSAVCSTLQYLARAATGVFNRDTLDADEAAADAAASFACSLSASPLIDAAADATIRTCPRTVRLSSEYNAGAGELLQRLPVPSQRGVALLQLQFPISI